MPVFLLQLLAVLGCGGVDPVDSTSEVGGPSRGEMALPEAATMPRSTEIEPDGHRRMLGVLREIRQHAMNDTNDYFSRAGALELGTALAMLPDDAPAMKKFELNASLGYRELLLGETEGAIEHLVGAWEILPGIEDQFGEDDYPARLPLLIGLAYLQKAEAEN